MQRSGHAFVLGSGIAGLSLGEILSRNGWRITLLDAAKELGGAASRSTQNWLHTGWLYAGLPQASAMLGCNHALQLFRRIYEPVLSPAVVNIEADEHGVSYPASSVGWFSPERVHYLYAIATHELSLWQRLAFRRYLDWVLLRRLHGFGYATEPARVLPPGLVALMNYWEGDDAGYTRYRVIPSTDARIDTKGVLTSLLGLLGCEAEIVTGAPPVLELRGDRTAVRIGGELHTPDLVVVASGTSVPTMLEQLGHAATARRFKSVSSPIVVLDHALDLPNFIRFTPQLPETLNHIKVAVGGKEISTLGSYDFFPAGHIPDIAPFVDKVCAKMHISRGQVAGSYYGTKTELTGDLSRQYNHAVERVNSNTYFAIAGKFSQFPLLVSDFAELFGLRIDIPNDLRRELRREVGSTALERVLGGLAGSRELQAA